MKSRKQQISRVEEAFKTGYQKKTEIPVGSMWESNVMRAVLRSGVPLPKKYFDYEGFGHLVWRFTAATCFFALVLIVYAIISEQGAASEVARSFFEDPLGVDMVHSLGII
jgi:hypothetical protein